MGSEKTQFKKGIIPHNKGKKLEDYLSKEKIEKITQTQFKKGERAGEKNNTWKGGVQTPKGDCVHLYAGVGKRVRRPKAIYEATYGSIPKGNVIYHLDGDKTNDDIDNLICITRAELLALNTKKGDENL